MRENAYKEIEEKALLLYHIVGNNCFGKNPIGRYDMFMECVKAAAISYQLDEVINYLHDISDALHNTDDTLYTATQNE